MATTGGYCAGCKKDVDSYVSCPTCKRPVMVPAGMAKKIDAELKRNAAAEKKRLENEKVARGEKV
jgi:hypothetical protein